jgi:hypothetical protein
MRVNGTLKVLDRGGRGIIAKWNYLHQDYRAGFPGRVNPEKGVVDACPRQRATGASVLDGFGVDSESQPKLVQRTGDRLGSLANWGMKLLRSTSVKSPIWLRLISATVSDCKIRLLPSFPPPLHRFESVDLWEVCGTHATAMGAP